MTKRCIGCGVKLQSISSALIGYVPSTKENPEYCERCFKIMHYNKASVAVLPKEEEKIISVVNSKAKFVFFLIDFLNINSETINRYKEVNCKKALLISKADVIPKSMKSNNIIDWIRNTYCIDDEIILISSERSRNISRIPNLLEKNNLKEAYILGFTNAGKSTLINALYEKFNEKKSYITTSLIPNTTLDFINIKVNDSLYLVDSPGFVLKDNIYSENEFDLVKRINPKNYINPIVYQTKSNMSINIEDKIVIKCNDNKNSLICYLSNSLNIKKSFKDVESEFLSVSYDVPANSDVVIKGLGFINVKKACSLDISIINHDLIEIRNSCFKGDINE